ncbi:MAG: hypothetical protein LBR27_10755 [Bifidobacteriaceae bacterium]|jgi:post-segregation antitoxin (ccd killing protein)|nr:hypothetical protein [Bifidobacteriaceae bacterium]
MPRIQVYLPDELHRLLKEQGLPASELLQTAVAAELRRRELESRADQYVEELLAEVGQPSEEEMARADAIAARIQAHAMAAAAA